MVGCLVMRLKSTITARQLRSVALRYRRSLQGRPRTAGRPASVASGLSDRPAQEAVESVQFRMRRLEAVLFLAREPLSSRKLSQYANLADGTEARTLVRRLNEWYDDHGRAFRAEAVAGGWQLLTRPKFASWIRRLGSTPREMRLSAPALETLAVVAYRQPVLRAEIEAIRGVACGEILRQLIERELVRTGVRSEELGRPYLYGTTKRFLQLFGLQSPDELPRARLIRGSDARSDESPTPTQPESTSVSQSSRQADHPPDEEELT